MTIKEMLPSQKGIFHSFSPSIFFSNSQTHLLIDVQSTYVHLRAFTSCKTGLFFGHFTLLTDVIKRHFFLLKKPGKHYTPITKGGG